MDALTVTLSGGKLCVSHPVFLGSTYALTFAGEAAGTAGLALYVTGRDTRVSLATSLTDGEGAASVAFTTNELVGMFRGCAGEGISLNAWLADSSGTRGHGLLLVMWSPLSVNIETGTAATMKGDTGTGVASVAKTGTDVVFTLTDGTTHTVSIADMKGDKGDTGSAVGPAAAAQIAALADGEPANLGGVYEELAALKAILKALDT